jgi:nicotinamide-nucleotide amidase
VRSLVSAAVIAVGSELLTPTRIDTNSLAITAALNTIGIAVRHKVIVGDVREDIAAAFRDALSRVDLVVFCGGIGPTDDDLTREAVAEVLGRPLAEDAGIVDRLRARFRARGLEMPEINRRQAMVPRGAQLVVNTNGTAPGLYLEEGEQVVALLPGPPRELKPMIDAIVRDHLAPRAGPTRLYSGTVRTTGLTESHAEQLAQPVYERWRSEGRPIDVTTLAAPASIDFHVRIRAADQGSGERMLASALDELRVVFGEHAYATRDQGMEQVVGELLRGRGYTIAAAESCTGGLLTSRLTDVPGSSAYVERAVVVYSNAAKTELLGVPDSLITAHGAVSEPVALAMASGVRARAKTTIGIAITGIAGPDGGSAEKPVGTVAIAVEGPWGRAVRTRQFFGGREQVKFFATQAALDDLRRALLRERS